MNYKDIAAQTETTYLNYLKIKHYFGVGLFLENYVVSGGEVTKDLVKNNVINVSDIVISFNDNVITSEGTSFVTIVPNTTYYVDFLEEGMFHFGTIHPSSNYFPLAEIETDSIGNVLIITDKRGGVGGFRLKQDIDLPGFAKVVSVKDFGAKGDGIEDDAPHIQAALDFVNIIGGGEVLVPNGTYVIKNTLSIFSKTKLTLEKNATILRGASNVHPMLMNGVRNVDSGYGYNGYGDIEISGGVWDGNSDNFPNQFPHMAFAHGRNITIRDTKIINNVNDHHIEMNSSKNVIIRNVHFEGYLKTSRNSEAIQIDHATPDGFPHFGPWDDTPCEDVLIDGCSFYDVNRAIGTHSNPPNNHNNIRIVNCHFSGCTDQAIFGRNYDNLVIAGNSFSNCVTGIEISNRTPDRMYNVTITNNVLKNMAAPSDTDWGAIRLFTPQSIANSGGRIVNAVVSDNIIEVSKSVVGILVRNCERIVVSNNIVNDVEGVGLNITRIDGSVVVKGNNVSNTLGNGIRVELISQGANVSANSVMDTKEHGIYINQSQDVNVNGNTVERSGDDAINQGNGIYTNNSIRVNVSANTVLDSIEHGISTKSSSLCTVSANSLNGCTLYVSSENDNISLIGNRVADSEMPFPHNYALRVAGGESTVNTLVMNNDLRNATVGNPLENTSPTSVFLNNVVAGGVIGDPFLLVDE